MVQNAVKELCDVGEKLTDDLDAHQLAAATKHIDALAHPLKPDDIQALLPLLPKDGDTADGLMMSNNFDFADKAVAEAIAFVAEGSRPPTHDET